MTELLPVLSTAFLTGLLGSAHCLGMCGGISGLFAVSANVTSLRTQVPKAFAYNIGRVLSYALLGSLVAVLGKTIVSLLPVLAGPVRLASGLIIIVIGLQIMFDRHFLAPIEQLGARLWKHLTPMTQKLIPTDSIGKAAGLGLIWGWLPCGLVYSALLIAAATAKPLYGGSVMLAFGLGTMPAMILTGLGASRMSSLVRRNKLGIGFLIVMLGIATLAMPVLGFFDASTHQGHGSQHTTL
jgi:sulfite exporter TauE/SafE